MFSSVKSRSVSPFNIRSFEYVGTSSRNHGSNQSSYTFNNISLGSTYPRTFLVISCAIFEINSANNVNTATVTIDGQNATVIVPEPTGGESNSHNSIHLLPVSNKTSISSLTIVPEDPSLSFAYGLWKMKVIRQTSNVLDFNGNNAAAGIVKTLTSVEGGAALSTLLNVNGSSTLSATNGVQNFFYDIRSGENFAGLTVYPTSSGTVEFTYTTSVSLSIPAVTFF